MELLLTFWASLVDGNDNLLVGWVGSLEGLALGTLGPFAIDEQTERLLICDAGGLDLSCKRHDEYWYKSELLI